MRDGGAGPRQRRARALECEFVARVGPLERHLARLAVLERHDEPELATIAGQDFRIVRGRPLARGRMDDGAHGMSAGAVLFAAQDLEPAVEAARFAAEPDRSGDRLRLPLIERSRRLGRYFGARRRRARRGRRARRVSIRGCYRRGRHAFERRRRCVSAFGRRCRCCRRRCRRRHRRARPGIRVRAIAAGEEGEEQASVFARHAAAQSTRRTKARSAICAANRRERRTRRVSRRPHGVALGELELPPGLWQLRVSRGRFA